MLTRLREWMRHVATLKGGLKVLVPEGFVFVSTRTMKMRTYSGFRASYRHFLERNGFEREGLNLHRFRHTYASMLLEQEINPKIVQKTAMPLTGYHCIDYVVSELAVIHITPEGPILQEISKNTTVEEVVAKTGAKLIIPEKVGIMEEA